MTAKSKILIFSDWYEPGFKAGGPIRSVANFAQQMNEDYDIYILTGDRDLNDRDPYPGIERDKWIAQGNVHVFYISPENLSWKNIKNCIANLSPDFIYLNNMYSRYFTIYPLLLHWMKKTKARIVLAPRGMLQKGAMQYKHQKKILFLKILRTLRILKNVRAHATDMQEQQDIAKHFPGIKRIDIIPNFSAPVSVYQFIEKKAGTLNILFISRVSPKKNLGYLLSLLSDIPSGLSITLTVRGGIEDADYWEACELLIKKLPPHITVNFNGIIQNNAVPALIRQHHVFVLPTLGENFGHAIFEALSAGRPVLISDQTPWKNLAAQKAGWDLPLNDAATFIKVITDVANMEDKEFQEWCKGAWQFAKSYQENAKLKEKYIELFS
ncbi:MAG: glycosyltransferase [Terrimonas sp.]|nr:glycosyltransferase [Terrimonas sp.]OJY87860.1 MAG: hypothetical protein BGP13_05405 [Sphingobacteriales bacterium 40-81]